MRGKEEEEKRNGWRLRHTSVSASGSPRAISHTALVGYRPSREFMQNAAQRDTVALERERERETC